ncbi:MAG TPA: EI24 domain-containing protein [Sulfurimonas autotrophica]|uniref:EI24 domain-containing protein n=1 Tax=Sulfurimonas autotrophica TaxID=202747 RepID=A0A7C3GBC5_9BACT|nr:EI24 domain-containing protein [Sulfurimonas autotrophica]
MQDFMDAVIFGFKEILRAKTMKFAMTSGLIISFIWIVIGAFFWDGIVSLSSSVLSLVPFSLIRSNGAWMLSTFLWLQAVLITFALIFAFLGNLIVQKVEREKYASLSLLIGLLSTAFWSVVWFYEGGYIYSQFLKLLTWLPFETIEKGLSYLIGFYIIYTGIVVTIIFVTSAYSTAFLQRVKERHFPYDRMYDDFEYKTIKQTIKDTAIFTAASIISFPLLFIPIVNFIILVGLWIWLMKDTLACDTAAFVFGEVDKEKLKEYKGAIWGIAFIGSLFNFIPVFNVFGPYFTELAMFYYFKEKRDS